MMYDVKIAFSRWRDTPEKIQDIKALREITPEPSANGVPSSNVMGLVQAKSAIEAMYADGSVTLRLTPEQYAALEYNRMSRARETDYTNREWYVDEVTPYFAEDRSEERRVG